MRFYIKHKLAAIVLIIIIPMTIFSINHYFEMLMHEKNDAELHNHSVTSDMAKNIGETINDSFGFLRALAKHPAVVNKDSKECDRLFSEMLEFYPNHLNILAAGMDGNNYCSGVYSPEFRSLNYNDRDWFQRGRNGEYVVGDMHISKFFKFPAVMIAMPVFDIHKKQVGVIGAPLNLTKLQQSLAEYNHNLPEESSITVIDSKDNILINTINSGMVGKNIREILDSRELFEKTEGSLELQDKSKTKYLYTFSSIPNARWRVIVAVPAEKAYHSAYHFSSKYIGFLIVVLLMAGIFSLFISRRITGNISALSSGLKEIEKGNLDYKLEISAQDELKELTDSFNQMAKERLYSEKKLRESQTFLSSVLDGIGDGVIVIDRDFRILSANKGYCNQMKVSCEEIIGKYCHQISHKSDIPCYEEENGCECTVKQCFETGKHHRAIHTHYDKDRNIVYVETNSYPLKDAEGNIVSAIETIADVTEQVMLERKLQEITEQYKKLYDDAPDMMQSVNKEGVIIICNKTEAKVLGYELDEIIGQHFIKIIPPETRNECILKFNAIKEKGVYEGELTFMAKDGRRIPVFMKSRAIYDEKGNFLMTDGIIRDISEKKALEAQLIQAQKMEAVGQLAGGIAHDFNNLLTAIIGYGSLLQEELKDNDTFKNYVTNILASAERASRLTESLLAFSRKQVINPKLVKLSDVITKLEKLLTRIIGEDIELKIMLSPEEIGVMVDPVQIEQVLMNLATNARDAMPEGGTLLIETELADFDAEYVRTHAYAKPGKHMLISVTDTGIGMDRKTSERIFEPFFTTKDIGKGTGLGLSMVYGIVKQLNGYINVYSEPGKGTIFKIYIPAVEGETVEIQPSIFSASIKGTETILVAEDDSTARELIKDVLEANGYKVIIAEDGEDALNKFKADTTAINLIVMDVIMPKKNGKEVYEEIKKQRPDMKAVFMSGYTANIIHKKGILEPGIELISKPFSPNALLRKIREVLDK